jgi:hypothetical protein
MARLTDLAHVDRFSRVRVDGVALTAMIHTFAIELAMIPDGNRAGL